MKKVFRRPACASWTLAVVIALGIGSESRLSGRQKPQTTPAGSSADIEVVEVQPDFYMIAGAGANIAVQVGRDGVVVVDTGSATATDRVLSEIQKVTKQPIRYIINTSADPDHVGGNERLSAAGQSIIPTGGLNSIASAGGRAVIFAEERVLARMSAPVGKQAAYPNGAWPTNSYSASLGESQKDVYLNGQAIQVFHQPAAATPTATASSFFAVPTWSWSGM
jgi:glyoxylase-like metal-dependent hydrolase (beta-lactamase superfamily II)